jgi:LacI family transcriptional regulator
LATIYDVASAAGVSPKTVSRVLNEDPLVSDKTRRLVNETMVRLQYVPSKAARSMRSRQSGLVGLISSAVSASTEAPAGLPSIFVVKGAQEVLAARGKTLLMADTGGDEARVPELVQMLLEHRVEGLLYVAEFVREVDLSFGVGQHSPIVLANCSDRRGTPSVVPDNVAGMRSLVAALLAANHRRIGYLTNPETNLSRGLRIEGYRQAHREYGVPFDPALIVTGATGHPVHDYRDLPAALDKLLALSDPPTVICTGNDKMALRLYGLLRQRGLDIPRDISVAGYDDYTIISEQVNPPLTTVYLAYREIGIAAAEKLLRIIDGSAEKEGQDVVSGPLIWRESTATLDEAVTVFPKRRRRRQ